VVVPITFLITLYLQSERTKEYYGYGKDNIPTKNLDDPYMRAMRGESVIQK